MSNMLCSKSFFNSKPHSLQCKVVIFKFELHNKGVNIDNDLEAWLTFLSVDDPEVIVRLIRQYPKFKDYYKEVYELCFDIEKVMSMFSKELAILDSNTVDYMIDEMQNTIDEQQSKLDEQQSKLDEQQSKLNEQQNMLDNEQKMNRELLKRIQELENQLK